MSKLRLFFREDSSFRFRPSSEDIEHIVENLKHGYLERQNLGLNFNLPFSLKVVVAGYEVPNPVLYVDLTDAVFNIESTTVHQENEDVELILVMVQNSLEYKVKGLFQHRIWEEDDLSTSGVSEGSLSEEMISQLELKKEFTEERKLINTEIHAMEQVDTTNVAPADRKNLVEVSNPLDVYFDVDHVNMSDAIILHDAMVKGILPYQYDENGNMLLNPKGAVPTMTIKGEKDKDNLNVLYNQAEIDIYQATLSYIIRKMEKEASTVIHLFPTTVIKSVFEKGLMARSYKIDFDKMTLSQKVGVPVVEDELLQLNESKVSVNSKSARSLMAFLLAIQYIIEDRLFNYQEEGFPVFKDKISRIEFAKLMAKL